MDILLNEVLFDVHLCIENPFRFCEADAHLDFNIFHKTKIIIIIIILFIKRYKGQRPHNPGYTPDISHLCKLREIV